MWGRRTAAALLALSVLACSSSTSPTMTGIVVDVTGDLTTVESFTVLVDGDRVTFVPTEEGDYAFPLPHLRDHLRSGEPVRVGFQQENGTYLATSLADA